MWLYSYMIASQQARSYNNITIKKGQLTADKGWIYGLHSIYRFAISKLALISGK